MSIEQRFERLECELAAARRWNRWLISGAAIALGLVVLAAVFSQGVAVAADEDKEACPKAGECPKEMRLQRLIIEDEQGNRVAVLEPARDGAQLRIYDKDGTNRLGLGSYHNGSGLFMFDEQGVNRIWLSAYSTAPGLRISDWNNRTRVLAMTDQYGPRIELNDETGRRRGFWRMTDKGEGMGLFDERGRTTWSAPYWDEMDLDD